MKTLNFTIILLSLLFGYNAVHAQFIHFEENFDTTDFRPGWSIDSTGDATATWDIAEDMYGNDFDSNLALVYDYSGNPVNEKLISPAINIAGYNLVYLVYDWIFWYLNTSSYGLVEVYNGTTWHEVIRYDSIDGSGHDSIDISAYQNYSLQVRFSYINPTGNGWESDYGIDNIQIISPPNITIGTPLPQEVCEGGSIRLSFNANDADFKSDNYFSVQLSDSLGNFSDPTILDTLQSYKTGMYLQSYNIPDSMPSGNQYKLRITASSPSYISDTCNEDITIKQNPKVNLGPGQNLCHDESLLLDAGTGMDNYFWQDGSSAQTFSADTSNGIEKDTLKMYHVSVTQNGCFARDTVLIKFENCVNLDDFDASTTGFWVYPNPTNDFILINNEKGSTIKLIDINGITHLEKNLRNTESTIDISQLPNGLYFLSIKNSSTHKTIKLMKK